MKPIDIKMAEARLRAQLGAGAVLPLPQARVVIRKQARQLGLYAGERLVKTYRVTLGRHPAGAKQRQGDGATPEGRYFICTRNPRSRFHLFLGLSYPNAADAARGLENRLIGEVPCAAMTAAEAARQRPPWDTPLGGEIGIHGGGTQPPDWTHGCIAVADEDIEELWLATEMGSPVEILP